ncbi:hypothetical protein DL764_009866 [Monosporascus ibericus]|uniref:Uncharacterized protein n=1 Tax=Monosporascus ibericus TaxID=155417 RepID=A0A4Q4SWX8_9PEZI|nr:hypothetical protein DL764_009866 [Monosporascus ibericus]
MTNDNSSRSGYDATGISTTPSTPKNGSRSGYDTSGTPQTPPSSQRPIMLSVSNTEGFFCGVGVTLFVIITLAMWVEKSKT